MQVKAFTVKRPRIEMVPLIDMFFLLLVFFIFGIFSMSMQQGIIVDLPQAKTAAANPKDRLLVISIAADGAMVVDRKPMAIEEFPAWLRLAQPQAQAAVINADRAAAYGIVMAVLDAVRQAGIQKVSFQTEPSAHDG